MKELAEFSLDDGTTFLVEVEEPASPAIERVAIPSGQLVLKAGKSFEASLQEVKRVAGTIVANLRDLGPSEAEVKFGLKMTADAGAIFTSMGGEVNFEVTVKWTRG